MSDLYKDTPTIGDAVNIGGSIGKITEITTKYIKVQRSYKSPKMGMSMLDHEQWTARFDPEQFSNKWSALDRNWNMSKARIKSLIRANMSEVKYRIVRDRFDGMYALEESVKHPGMNEYWFRQLKKFNTTDEAHQFLLLQIQTFKPLEFDKNGIQII